MRFMSCDWLSRLSVVVAVLSVAVVLVSVTVIVLVSLAIASPLKISVIIHRDSIIRACSFIQGLSLLAVRNYSFALICLADG